MPGTRKTYLLLQFTPNCASLDCTFLRVDLGTKVRVNTRPKLGRSLRAAVRWEIKANVCLGNSRIFGVVCPKMVGFRSSLLALFVDVRGINSVAPIPCIFGINPFFPRSSKTHTNFRVVSNCCGAMTQAILRLPQKSCWPAKQEHKQLGVRI